MKSLDEKWKDVLLSMTQEQKNKANKALKAINRSVNLTIDTNNTKNLISIAVLIKDHPSLDIASEVNKANSHIEENKKLKGTMWYFVRWVVRARGYKDEREAQYADKSKR